MTEERDILKRRFCPTLKVHPRGYYVWLAEPKFVRAKEDQRPLGLIKRVWLERGRVYRYRKIHDELRELGKSCGRHGVSRRGNFHDNTVAEISFQLRKREGIRRKTYTTREEARSDMCEYTEIFYNPKRRHGSAMQLSPVEFEKRYFQSMEVSRSAGALHYGNSGTYAIKVRFQGGPACKGRTST